MLSFLQIGNLEGYYHFQFNVSQRINATLGKSVPRSIGSLSHMMSSPDLTRTLQQHQNVIKLVQLLNEECMHLLE